MKNSYLLLILFLLVACRSLEDAGKVLRNEKVNTTDEFLVERKETLVFPPDFKKIPEPGAIVNKKTSDQEKIKKILKAPKETKIGENNSSSIEKSILEKIRK